MVCLFVCLATASILTSILVVCFLTFASLHLAHCLLLRNLCQPLKGRLCSQVWAWLGYHQHTEVTSWCPRCSCSEKYMIKIISYVFKGLQSLASPLLVNIKIFKPSNHHCYQLILSMLYIFHLPWRWMLVKKLGILISLHMVETMIGNLDIPNTSAMVFLISDLCTYLHCSKDSFVEPFQYQ